MRGGFGFSFMEFPWKEGFGLCFMELPQNFHGEEDLPFPSWNLH